MKGESPMAASESNETPASSPVPPPANVGVGGKETQFEGGASNPNERKSIAEDPEGKDNASGSSKSKK
jgi:hypothetical protein